MQIAAVRCGQYTQTVRHALQLPLSPLLQVLRKNEKQVLHWERKRYGSSGKSGPPPLLIKPFLNVNSIRSMKGVVADAIPEKTPITRKEQTSSPTLTHHVTPEHTAQRLAMETLAKEEKKSAPTVETQQFLFSVTTAQILRYTARDLGYQIMPDGFVRVTDILRHDFYRDYDFKKFVKACQRDPLDSFEVARLPEYHNGVMTESWWTRARRGHNIPVVDGRTHRVLNETRLPTLTYVCHPDQWDTIREFGIHESEDCVIPLFRTLDGQVYASHRIPNHVDRVCVSINPEKAMKLGTMFFITWNRKIYAVGNRNRVIPPESFHNAVEIELKKKDLLHNTGLPRRKG